MVGILIKSLSQVISSRKVAEAIAREVGSGKKVLEIGGGTGVVTRALARENNVTASEIDRRMIEALREIRGVKVAEEDALKADFNKFEAVAGNIPFSISSKIVLKFVESKAKIAVFVLQREFAEKICATPGEKKAGRISVAVWSRAKAEIREVFGGEEFIPKQKSEAALVVIERAKRKIEVSEEAAKMMFQHKNQRIKKAIMNSWKEIGSKEKAKEMAEKTKFGKKRPRELKLEEWAEFSREWKELKEK